MPKVLSQSGSSLADVYDVEGSIAGVETLVSRDVSLVHEMGATIFSERLVGQIFIVSSGAIAQSTVFNAEFPNSFSVPSRIQGIIVTESVAGRTGRAQVSVASIIPGAEQDFPLWAWESGAGSDFSRSLTVEDAGSIASPTQLVPSFESTNLPSMLLGTDQPESRQVPGLMLRGATGAFGAGTVTVIARIYLTFANPVGVSSYGLPIPGW